MTFAYIRSSAGGWACQISSGIKKKKDQFLLRFNMTADKCREKKFMRAFMHISEKLPFNQNEYFLSA